MAEYTALRQRSGAAGVWDRDVLNDHFAGRWEKLPKQCNWLNYEENHPGAITDPAVYAVHARMKWNPHSSPENKVHGEALLPQPYLFTHSVSLSSPPRRILVRV